MKQSTKDATTNALLWIKDNTLANSTIASWINDGHKIAYIAERKNIMDSNFMLIKDANERLDDIDRIYTTSSEIEAIKVMNKYSADYIMLSPQILGYYRIDGLNYIEEKCFHLAYDNIVKIYKVNCVV
jgi:uncharacterized membrane protein